MNKQQEDNIQNLDRQEAIVKMQELVKHNSICLFTTQLTKLPLQTRPMNVQKVCDQGNFWFLSSSESSQNEHINQDQRVQLFFGNNSDSEYLTVYGNAFISYDKQKIQELWSPWVNAFMEGEEDPRVTIINPDCSYPVRSSCFSAGCSFSGFSVCTTDFRLTKGWNLVCRIL